MSHIDELQALIDKWRAEKKRKCENCKHWDNWVFRLTTIKYRNPRWVNYSFGVCNSQDGYYGYGVLLDKNSDAENCKDFTPRGDVNMDFESEVRKLLAKMKPEEKPEEKPFIEPCPICGGEMCKSKAYGVIHLHKSQDVCPWRAKDIETHNVIARVLREADSWTRGYMSTSYAGLRDAMKDFRAIQAEVKEAE